MNIKKEYMYLGGGLLLGSLAFFLLKNKTKSKKLSGVKTSKESPFSLSKPSRYGSKKRFLFDDDVITSKKKRKLYGARRENSEMIEQRELFL